MAAESLHDEAVTVLQSIDLSPPSDWSASKPTCKPDWELLGAMYQSAAAMYCISSMQSLSVLVCTTELNVHSEMLATCLQARLKTAVLYPRVKRFMFWPLMVLGVAAAQGDDAMRTFVAGELSHLSFFIGTCVPSAARAVLEKFWSPGEVHWDASFNQAYVFPTQIAVDTSRMEA